jgi:hypothetical protein
MEELVSKIATDHQQRGARVAVQAQRDTLGANAKRQRWVIPWTLNSRAASEHYDGRRRDSGGWA